MADAPRCRERRNRTRRRRRSTDHRPVPRGVLPRGVQTWIMAGVAVGMLAIMLIVGRPDPPARPGDDCRARAGAERRPRPRLSGPPAAARGAGDARGSDGRAGAERPAGPVRRHAAAAAAGSDRDRSKAARIREPLCQQRRSEPASRERAAGPRSEHVTMPTASGAGRCRRVRRSTKWPTRWCRATARTAGAAWNSAAPASAAGDTAASAQSRRSIRRSGDTPDHTPPISAAGPLHRVLEGTVIDTVLTNRLDGARAAPVNCLVTNALYSHTGRQVLIPAGARILGETKPVQAFGETRLAVSFHRLLMPDGRTLPPRPVPRTESDWRRRPARQGESALPVHVRRGGGRWPDQRPVAVPREVLGSAAAMGTERSSSPAASATRRRRPRCR